jgi:hypothetical protein
MLCQNEACAREAGEKEDWGTESHPQQPPPTVTEPDSSHPCIHLLVLCHSGKWLPMDTGLRDRGGDLCFFPQPPPLPHPIRSHSFRNEQLES